MYDLKDYEAGSILFYACTDTDEQHEDDVRLAIDYCKKHDLNHEQVKILKGYNEKNLLFPKTVLVKLRNK